MTHYSNGEKIRKGSKGNYICVYLTNDQYDFLQRECEKLNMKASVYMRELLQQFIEESKDYLNK